jgi:hypothetical protein
MDLCSWQLLAGPPAWRHAVGTAQAPGEGQHTTVSKQLHSPTT